MPIVPIRGLGSGGIVQDTAAVLLEPNVFSDGRNVKFDDGSVRKRLGHTQILPDLTDTDTTTLANPHFGLHWPRPDTRYNIYASPTEVWRMNQAGNLSSIYTTATAGSRWHGSLFTGGYAVVMNNTVDIPVYSLYDGLGTLQDTTLVALPNWNYTANTEIRAGVVRAYRNFLVAGDISSTFNNVVTRAPGTLRISSAAAAGQIPQNWQPGALGQRDSADELELSQTEAIIDMAPLRGNLFVYTGDSIHSISIGSNFTNVSDYASGYGCLAIDCVASFDGQHFVVDRNDMYIHAGSGQVQSVIDGRNRKYFYDNLNQDHFENTFVSVNRAQDEIWVCFPNLSANGQGDCNEALVWNYRDNTWTIYDIPNARAGFEGPMVRNDLFQLAEEKLVLVSRNDSRFYAMDEGNTFNGANFLAFVERKRTVAQADGSSKWLGQFYPIFDAGTSSTAITISLRGQNTFVQDISFTDRTTDVNIFNPQDTDRGYKIDPRTSGRLINYRIETEDENTWVLSGISVMVEEEDKR